MSNSIAGYGGSLASTPDMGESGGGAVTEITDWEANVEFDELDVTSFASAGSAEYIPGVQRGTFSFNAVGLHLPPMDRTERTVTLKAKASGGPEISAKAIVRSTNFNVDHGDKAKYSHQGRFTGAITPSNPATPA